MTKSKWVMGFLLIVLASGYSSAQTRIENADSSWLLMGADQWRYYLPLLEDKMVAVVANQTSMVGDMHLVDFLLSKHVNITKVFAPEHGFRGEAGPGDKVQSGTDAKTKLPVISLYGSKRKPAPADLTGIEYMLFDIQDVGARFYTYISTLHYLMEACAENNIQLIVLDRPNPNGFYIDGPVLDTAYRSFVGIAPIPVVHGLTLGEYAKMATGEGWLNSKNKIEVKVIPMANYKHSMRYDLPIKPSPNLPNSDAVYLYPSLCFFEGTAISVGRGTSLPFQLVGYPGYDNGKYKFTPVEIPGVITDPPYENVECKGTQLGTEVESILTGKKLRIDFLVDMYEYYAPKDKFFNVFFDKLAGNGILRRQIMTGMTAKQISDSWIPDLEKYKVKRAKYLLYPD